MLRSGRITERQGQALEEGPRQVGPRQEGRHGGLRLRQAPLRREPQAVLRQEVRVLRQGESHRVVPHRELLHQELLHRGLKHREVLPFQEPSLPRCQAPLQPPPRQRQGNREQEVPGPSRYRQARPTRPPPARVPSVSGAARWSFFRVS
jgi:hypothetical protein